MKIKIKIESEIEIEKGIEINGRGRNQDRVKEFRIGNEFGIRIVIEDRGWNRNQKSRSRILRNRIGDQVKIENRDGNRELGLRSGLKGKSSSRWRMENEIEIREKRSRMDNGIEIGVEDNDQDQNCG
jgi:hypothetical protein